MEKLYSKIVGTPVFEDDLPQPLTSVKDVVMDPERGKVVALVVNVNKKEVLAPYDIIKWNDVIRIMSRENITPSEDIIRVNEVMKSGIEIMANSVVTEDGERLGKVFDYTVNPNTFDLRKIYCAKSLLGMFRYDSRIIPVKKIVEVLEDRIVVKNDTKVKQEVKAVSGEMAY